VAQKGKKTGRAAEEQTVPVVERLGEEITLRTADTGVRGLLARFFAPMRERAQLDDAGNGDGKVIDVEFSRDDELPSAEADVDTAESGGRKRRREERKARRQAERASAVAADGESDD
jgi:hypothetical protein